MPIKARNIEPINARSIPFTFNQVKCPPTDKCILSCIGDTVFTKAADIVSATDYSPFGAPLAGRVFSSNAYRFGYSGMEKVSEISGEGNHIDYGARIRDARIGPWLSVDPLFYNYHFISPYTYAANKPIMFLDFDGRDIIPSNQFKSSAYFNVTTTIINNFKTMPDANKYFSPFLKAGKDLHLTYHSLSGREIGSISLEKSRTKLGVTMKQDKAKLLGFQSITFNSDATFLQMLDNNGLPIKRNGDEYVGKYVSEIAMANTVIHEVMHANKLTHEEMADATIRAEMTNSLLRYAEIRGLQLSLEEAKALSWAGLHNTNAWNALSKDDKKKITETIREKVYGKETFETFSENSERFLNQESSERLINETIKPSK